MVGAIRNGRSEAPTSVFMSRRYCQGEAGAGEEDQSRSVKVNLMKVESPSGLSPGMTEKYLGTDARGGWRISPDIWGQKQVICVIIIQVTLICFHVLSILRTMSLLLFNSD